MPLLNKRINYLFVDLVITSQLLLRKKNLLNIGRKMQHRKFALSLLFKTFMILLTPQITFLKPMLRKTPLKVSVNL